MSLHLSFPCIIYPFFFLKILRNIVIKCYEKIFTIREVRGESHLELDQHSLAQDFFPLRVIIKIRSVRNSGQNYYK